MGDWGRWMGVVGDWGRWRRVVGDWETGVDDWWVTWWMDESCGGLLEELGTDMVVTGGDG